MSDQQPIKQDQSSEEIATYIASLESQLEATDGVDFGGGAWVDLFGTAKLPDGTSRSFRINMTSHARTPAAALENLVAGMRHAADNFGLHPYDPTSKTSNPPARSGSPAPAPSGAQDPAPARSGSPAPVGSPAPAPAPAPAGAPAPSGSENGGSFVCDRIDVTPLDGDRVEIAFWVSGRKYPELKWIRATDAVVNEFIVATNAEWTRDNFTRKISYSPFAMRVKWVYSANKNQNGQPYKNYSGMDRI